MNNFPSPADAFAEASLRTADADPAIMAERVIAETSDSKLMAQDAQAMIALGIEPKGDR